MSKAGDCAICGFWKSWEGFDYENAKALFDYYKICNKHKKEYLEMETNFPKSQSDYIKADVFQDSQIPVRYIGYSKKANEDRTVKGKVVSWKESLKFTLRYSYPEMAKDEAGELRLDKEGKPFQNQNYDPNYPHGYSIIYHFDIGNFESGSLPVWNAFKQLQPKPGDHLLISKTGKDKETRWTIKKAGSPEEKVYDVDRSRAEQDQEPF